MTCLTVPYVPDTGVTGKSKACDLCVLWISASRVWGQGPALSDIYKVKALGKLLDFAEPQCPRLQPGTVTGHLCQEWPHGPPGWSRCGPSPVLPAVGTPGAEGGWPLPGRGYGLQVICSGHQGLTAGGLVQTAPEAVCGLCVLI